MAVTINGSTKTITLESGVVAKDVADIYSEWKAWVATGDNAKYLPAFRVIGGDPLGGGISAGSYYFLQNDIGWQIKPPEENIVITLSGNLYGEDSGQPLFNATDGSFNTSIRLATSSLTQTSTVISGSGLDAAQDTKLSTIHDLLNTIEGTLDHREVMRIFLAALVGKTTGIGSNTETYKGQAGEDRIVATFDSENNRSLVVLDGT